ncbi:MAG: MCE family protein [Paludibacteraceae bacterium]|nr:MCE family protein [Paludibacteraceae bacterium]
MKYAREIKVGALATLCLFLLFFGFNFLKGVNIFSPTNSYHGRYTNLHGLEEQAAVNILGHKVGQVDAIHYDFTSDTAFIVDISIRRDIQLPQGTRMALVASGLLGGMAIELQFPSDMMTDNTEYVKKGAFIPTAYVPGLVESVQTELLGKLSGAVEQIDSLVENINAQLADNHLNATLANAERVSSDLTVVSKDLKQLMHTRVPAIVNNADTTLANLNKIVADVRSADLKTTVARVDTAVDQVNVILAGVKSQDGTLGQLIYNKSLYTHIDSTVVSADSLLVDLKANPKRYVHFSLFGAKEKKKKN